MHTGKTIPNNDFKSMPMSGLYTRCIAEVLIKHECLISIKIKSAKIMYMELFGGTCTMTYLCTNH